MRYPILLGGMIVVLCGTQARADEPPQTQDDFSFGLGMGVNLPADLTVPNIAVASFRLGNMQFQPFVTISNTEADEESDDGVASSKDDASEETRGVGPVFKYAFARRNKMDLQFIASLGYARASSSSNPEGPDNSAGEKTKSFDVSYGLGLEWWFASQFSLMATATNPVYTKTSTRTTQEQPGGIETFIEANDRSYGLVWDPSISFAIMTWF